VHTACLVRETFVDVCARLRKPKRIIARFPGFVQKRWIGAAGRISKMIGRGSRRIFLGAIRFDPPNPGLPRPK